MEETIEGSGSIDDANKGEVPKEIFIGLHDIEKYDIDELSQEYDSEDEEVLKYYFQIFKLPKRMEDHKWVLGTYFATKEDFKEAVRTYAIHSGRNLKFKKSDNKRMRVICKKGCPWESYCAKLPDEDTWKLRKIMDKHTCSRDYKVRFLNCKWLGKNI